MGFLRNVFQRPTRRQNRAPSNGGGAQADIGEEDLDTGVQKRASRRRSSRKDTKIAIVYDSNDKEKADGIVDSLQPHFSHEIIRLDENAQNTFTATSMSNVDLALVLVSQTLENHKVFGMRFQTDLLPVFIDDNMLNQGSWHGNIGWYLSNSLYLNLTKPFIEEDPSDKLLEFIKGHLRNRQNKGQYDVFISHNWGTNNETHEKALELAKALKQLNLKVWVDQWNMAGKVDSSMANGIDASAIFLILGTKTYMNKINTGSRNDNCVKEFSYGMTHRFDKTVVAAIEPEMLQAHQGWTGHFKLSLTRQRPVDVTKMDDDAFSRLADKIRQRISEPMDAANKMYSPRLRDLHAALIPNELESGIASTTKQKADLFTQGTRSWVFNEFEEWYKNGSNNVFVLQGDGGLGKSVIMAQICQRGGVFLEDQQETEGVTQLRRRSSRIRSLWRRSHRERDGIKVAACHFFKHDNGTLSNARNAILNISWQLAVSIPGFLDGLPDAEDLESNQWSQMTLPDLFERLIATPANKLSPPPKPVVVVVDALDECSTSQEFARQVVSSHWARDLPPWLRLAISMRPESSLPAAFRSFEKTTIDLKDTRNMEDMRIHLQHILRNASQDNIFEANDIQQSVDILLPRSEGLFLWASFLGETLKRVHNEKKSILTLDNIRDETFFPEGVNRVFTDYFYRFQEAVGGKENYSKILGPIVAAREYLSVSIFHELLGFEDEDDTNKFLMKSRNLIYKSGDGRYGLVHKRMADFLVDMETSGLDLFVNQKKGHQILANYCLNTDTEFGYKHLVYHLCKAGRGQDAIGKLDTFKWLSSAISQSEDATTEQRFHYIGELVRDCEQADILKKSTGARILSICAHILAEHPKELASQILAHIPEEENCRLRHTLIQPKVPWLRPLSVSMRHPRGPLLRTLQGHTGNVTCVAVGNIDKDTHIVVSGSSDRSIRIWDPSTGEERLMIDGNFESFTCIAISQSGNVIVSGSTDKMVHIWYPETEKKQHVLEGHSAGVTSVAVSEATRTVVSGSWDNTVRIWDLETGEERHVLEGHSGYVTSVAVSEATKTVVSGSDDQTVRIWDLETGEELHVLEGHSDYVTSVAVNEATRTVVSGSFDQTVRIWDLETGEERRVLEGHSGYVTSVAVSEATNTVVSGSFDQTVRIWDLETGQELHVLEGHSEEVTTVAVSEATRTVVSGSWDNTVRIWDLETGEKRRVLEGHSSLVTSVAVNEATKTVVSGSFDQTVRIWDLETGERRGKFGSTNGHSARVTSVAVSEATRTVVSGSDDQTVRIWDLETGEERRVLEGHSGYVTSVAVSDATKTVVSGSWDNTVRIWDLETGEERRVLEGHSGYVTSVAVSEATRTVVSGSFDQTVRIWDLETGEELHVLEGHSGRVPSVAVSEATRTVVSGSFDQTVRIWDLETGEERRVLEGHSGYVTSVAVNEATRTVVSVSFDQTVRIWNLSTGKELHVLEGHSGYFTSVAVSEATETVVSGSWDKTVRIWDLETGQERRVLEGHSGDVTTVAVSEATKTVISGSRDKTVRIWDLETGQERLVLEGHSGDVTSVAVSEATKTVISGSRDKTVRIWDLETGQERHVLGGIPNVANSVVVSDATKTVVARLDDQTVRIWDLETGEELHVLEGHSDYVTSVAVSEATKTVVSGSFDQTVRIWDLETGEERRVLEGHSGYVTSVAVSEATKTVVSGSFDQTVRIWDLETGEELHVLEGHSGYVTSVAVSEATRTVVSGSDDQTVRIWDLETGEELHVLEGHSGRVPSVAVSEATRTVVSGSDDQTVRIWDLETGEELHVLEGHSEEVTSVAVSDATKTVVSGSWDNTVRIWSLDTGEELHVLRGHSEEVISVAVSDATKTVVSGSPDKTVRIWDLETGEELHVLEGHSEEVISVAVSDATKTVVSGSPDKTVRIWNLETGQKQDILRLTTGHFKAVTTVAVSEATKTVVSGSDDQTVRIWDLETGEELHVLEGHSNIVTSVAVSEATRTVVSGSWDKTVRIWDLETGEELHVLEGHSEEVTSVAVSDATKTVVSGSPDQTVRIWDLEMGTQRATLECRVRWVLVRDNIVQICEDDGKIQWWNLENKEYISFDEDEVLSSSSFGLVPNYHNRVLLGNEQIGFSCDADISQCVHVGSIIIVGDESGGMHFLKYEP